MFNMRIIMCVTISMTVRPRVYRTTFYNRRRNLSYKKGFFFVGTIFWNSDYVSRKIVRRLGRIYCVVHRFDPNYMLYNYQLCVYAHKNISRLFTSKLIRSRLDTFKLHAAYNLTLTYNMFILYIICTYRVGTFFLTLYRIKSLTIV